MIDPKYIPIIVGAYLIFIIIALLGYSSHRRRNIWEKRKKSDWIPSWVLIDSDGAFRSCPRCNELAITKPWLGTMILEDIRDANCGKCKHFFVEHNKGRFSKGFQVMTAEAYRAWTEAKGYTKRDKLSQYLKEVDRQQSLV